MNAWLPVMLWSLGLGCVPAAEETDALELGSGRDGPLTVAQANQVINHYAQVTGPAAPGDEVLLVADTRDFSAGGLVMVLQATSLVPEPLPGLSKPLALPEGAGGPWEFARLASVGEGVMTLSEPLAHSYAAGVTQVIRVPEYTRVQVRKGASLRAEPWNGRTGGVIAFLATETLLNEGAISASGAGFRGGAPLRDAFSPMSCRDSGGGNGGMVVVHTRELRGGGSISADGEAGDSASAGRAGGGGAGGHIFLRVMGLAERGAMSARGDDGGGGRATFPLDHTPCPLLIDSASAEQTPRVNSSKESATNVAGKSCNDLKITFPGPPPWLSDHVVVGVKQGFLTVKGTMPDDVTSVEVTFGGTAVTPVAVLDKNKRTWEARVKPPPVIKEDPDKEIEVDYEEGALYTISANSLGRACTSNEVKFKVDLTVPDVEIKSGPEPTTNKKKATFELFSSAEDVKEFKCAWGKSPELKNFWNCEDFARFVPKGGGYYTVEFDATEESNYFQAAFVDGVGNEGRSLVYVWQIDTSPPVVKFRSPARDEWINTRTPFFRGQVIPVKPGVTVTLAINKEGNSKSVVGTALTDKYGYWNFAPPAEEELTDGHYTVSATAKDQLGNSSTGGDNEQGRFVVDTTPPRTRILQGPPSVHGSRKSEFVFSVWNEEEAEVEFECRFEKGGFNDGASFSCSRTASFDRLVDGDYILVVRAKDKAGNLESISQPKDKVARHEWTVHVLPPLHPDIFSPEDGETVETRTPIITGTAVGNGKVYVVIDGVPIGNPVTTNTEGRWTFQPPFRLEPGAHVLSSQVMDFNETLSELSPEIHFNVTASRDDLNVGKAIGGGVGCTASGSASPLFVSWGLLYLVGIVRRRRS